MKVNGLTTEQVNESRAKHGTNALTKIPVDPLWKKFLHGFTDPMIMILIVALVVQVVLVFVDENAHWFEPVGILAAILIANGVSSISENSQENKASALKEEEEAKEKAKVIRNGELEEIHVSEVVKGDIIFLQAGDKIAADGEIVQGEIKVDQSVLNGETEEASKAPNPNKETYDIKDLLNPYYCYRGTVVCQSEAYMEVKEIGDTTLFGQLALEVQEETRATPLQVKLKKLAKQISTFGYIGATAIALSIVLKTIFGDGAPNTVVAWIHLFTISITTAVTIIVCAVPEGLPMLTSILLSLQSLKMAKDNVLVRKIQGLETAGSLSLLFSDKTGTITEGKLSITEIMIGNGKTFDSFGALPKVLLQDYVTGTGINNSASLSNGNVIGGNSTDRALMTFIAGTEGEALLKSEKVTDFEPFDSAKKYSVVKVERDGKKYSFIKGAPERVVEKCSRYLDENGNVQELPNTDALIDYLNTQSARAMRLLAVARQEGDALEKDLTLVALLCIRDNVRAEAVDAICEVQNAGIQVAMITGDRIETASAIARDAKLLVEPTDVAMTSAEMATKSDDELKKILPHLRVVARALPTDKSRLVRIAQELNLVVGMTGDGVNDAPALKKADVGFAMGSGTEVAKEAGDITILDDNFVSIAKAILYGRTMFKSIRKFLIFQLTVNVAAVLTCFAGPLLGVKDGTVFTVVQILFINLVMDTLAAIAFGSEPALKEYMREKPIPRSESIVTKGMFARVLTGGLYLTAITLLILFVPQIRSLFGQVEVTPYLKSAVFAVFMMGITLNGFNARTDHLNPFHEISKNLNFILVMGSIIVLQYVFITFGGKVLSVEPLSLKTWGLCLMFASLVFPIDIIRKLLVKS